MESIYTVSSSCSSVTYGNIAQHVKELVKLKFRNNFFKYETISSEIAYRNIRKQQRPNSKNGYDKREKPYLIIRPSFSVPEEMYLYDTPLTTNVDYLETSLDKRYLFPIIQDNVNGIGLSYKLNRDKIDFQVSVIVSTLFSQIDEYKRLVNTVVWNRPFTKKCPMESMIPREIIKMLAMAQNTDIDNANYAAGPFLENLNHSSAFPITYKMRNATACDEYFMYSNQNILFTFSDLQINEGTKKNMADDSFEITFRVTAEFNLPGLFVLYGSDELKEKMFSNNIQADLVSGSNRELSFPLFTLDNFFVPETAEIDGFRKFTSSMIDMQPDPKTNIDTTNFGAMLNSEIVQTIRSYYTNKIDISTLIRLQLYKNNLMLTEGVEYSVDWYKLNLDTINPTKEDTYRMVLYVNLIRINQIIVDATDSNASDSPGLN